MTSEREALNELQRLVDSGLAGGTRERSVLDAGCGFTLPVALPTEVRLVGLDISPEALALNARLDSRIVGDIQTYPLPAESFDVVLCWTVLEHLPDPRAAVANMARALKSGGLLVVGVPNVWSLRGLVTRLTPHRFHVWAYRRLLRFPQAGTPGYGPFPTHLKSEIAPRRLAEVARAENLEPVYAATYGLPSGLSRGLDAFWSLALALGRIVTFGAWDAAASEHLVVFRKPVPST
jgi:SAM-dependent methyltransferase